MNDKITVYLSGPMDLLECKGQSWRSNIIEEYKDRVNFINPPVDKHNTLDELIAGDLDNISKSDVLLWNSLPGPSHGSSMEAFYTKTVLKKPVVLVCRKNWKPQWPKWTASAVYNNSVRDALDDIIDCYNKRKTINKSVVVLCGPKRAGKDTFADMLLKEVGFGEKLAFATPIKQAAKILFQVSDEAEEDKDTYMVRPNLTYRKVLQELPYTLLNNVDRKLLIDNLLKRIEDSTSKLIVISDCRLEIEAESLKSRFGNNCLIFKILRDSALRNMPEDKHITEQQWYNIKANEEVSNDSNLRMFKNQCKYFVEKYDSLRNLKEFSSRNILDKLVS